MIKIINVPSSALKRVDVYDESDGYVIKFYTIKNIREGDRIRLFIDGKADNVIYNVCSVRGPYENGVSRITFVEEDYEYEEYEDMPSYEKIIRTKPNKEL